jgi:hypothetical protein
MPLLGIVILPYNKHPARTLQKEEKDTRAIRKCTQLSRVYIGEGYAITLLLLPAAAT